MTNSELISQLEGLVAAYHARGFGIGNEINELERMLHSMRYPVKDQRLIDASGAAKAHRFLILKALEKGLTVLVTSEGDVLCKSDRDFENLFAEAESVDEVRLDFFLNDRTYGWAYIVHEYGENYTVNDHGTRYEWIDETLQQFDRLLGEMK